MEERPCAIVGLVGVIAGVVTVIGFVQGDEPGPAQPTPTTTARAGPESFRGEVGDLKEGTNFLEFVFDHDGEVVRLDLQLTAQDVYGGGGGVGPYFRIWNDCNGEQVPQKSPEQRCFGWQFTLNPARTTDSFLSTLSGAHVEGYFAILVRGNLHMGLNVVTLKPLTADRAIELTRG